MIVLMGHHDAGRKLLKKLVTYQDAIVYDCTDSNKYSDLRVSKKNSFIPARKLYDESVDYTVITIAKTKDEAIDNFFSSVDFLNDVESILDSYIRVQGRGNYFIILMQDAYDGLKQYWKKFFNRLFGGEDRNIFLLWDEIKDDYADALSWTPDEKTVKYAKKACQIIENTIGGHRRKVDWDDDEDEESEKKKKKKSGKISHKVTVRGEEIDLDEYHRHLMEQELRYFQMKPTMLDDMDKAFPALFPKESDQLTDRIQKAIKRDKKRMKKMKKEKDNFYTGEYPKRRFSEETKRNSAPGSMGSLDSDEEFI